MAWWHLIEGQQNFQRMKERNKLMTLQEYFSAKQGIGILSTADGEGKVTTAIYSRPRIQDNTTLAFIMRERLTYHNLQTNPNAAFMFIEENQGYRGIRLFLKKLREDNDPAVIAAMTRRHLSPEEDQEKGPKHLVIFRVEMILPLIGSGPGPVTLS